MSLLQINSYALLLIQKFMFDSSFCFSFFAKDLDMKFTGWIDD